MIAFAVLHEDMPEPIEGSNGDELALDMLEALNVEAWNNTRYIRWNFPGGHHYVWDKQTHIVEVKWNDNRVILQTKNPSNGIAWVNGESTKSAELISTAWGFFCNDSFWLSAPFKVMDPGTERSVVRQDEEGSSLMVKYTSGGTTHGDVYVWHLDKKGMPYEYQMWVDIIPIGGIKAAWTGWEELSSGAMISTSKNLINAIPLDISPVQSGNSLEDLGLPLKYFSADSTL